MGKSLLLTDSETLGKPPIQPISFRFYLPIEFPVTLLCILVGSLKRKLPQPTRLPCLPRQQSQNPQTKSLGVMECSCWYNEHREKLENLE